jgi:uncharacterized UBP type Zn finger protein
MTTGDAIDLSNPCEHVTAATPRHTRRPREGCVDCMKIGGQWVHLRLCLTCGHVACCDSSPNKHATAHFHATRHPMVTSVEVGETWAYCYADDQFLSAE